MRQGPTVRACATLEPLEPLALCRRARGQSTKIGPRATAQLAGRPPRMTAERSAPRYPCRDNFRPSEFLQTSTLREPPSTSAGPCTEQPRPHPVARRRQVECGSDALGWRRGRLPATVSVALRHTPPGAVRRPASRRRAGQPCVAPRPRWAPAPRTVRHGARLPRESVPFVMRVEMMPLLLRPLAAERRAESARDGC